MRYPTDRRGLIIPPYQLGFTIPTEEQLQTRRVTTRHHGYWQRRNYGTQIESIFRNLVTNAFDLLREQHEDLHHDYDAPIKPKDVVMIDVLEEHLSTYGVIECIREKSTHSTYQVTQEQWERILWNATKPTRLAQDV